jgi:hypothetical protein
MEPFGYSMMGLFGAAAASKPLFAALGSNEDAVGILYFVVLLLAVLLVALYGWLALSAGLLALRDAFAPSLLPAANRATPYLVFATAALMLIGLSTIAVVPGDQPEPLTVNGFWFLIPALLLGLSAYDLLSRRRVAARVS